MRSPLRIQRAGPGHFGLARGRLGTPFLIAGWLGIPWAKQYRITGYMMAALDSEHVQMWRLL